MIPTKLMTFAELTELYLDDLLIKPSLGDDYWATPTVYDIGEIRRLFKAKVHPSIGNIQLNEFDVFTHKILYKDLYSQGISNKYMHWIVMKVKNVLSFAFRKGLINKEIVESFSFRLVSNYLNHMLSVQEIESLQEAAFKIKNAVMYPLALFTGMKGNEIRALFWSDIDPVNHTLSVQRYVGRTPDNLKYTINPIKTVKQRTIYLSKQAWNNFCFHYACEFSGASLGAESELPQQLIFHIKSDPHVFLSQTALNVILYDVKFLTGIESITFDSLRHQYIATAMKQTNDPVAIKTLVGYRTTDPVLSLRKYIYSIP